ncbi:MAG: LysR substrate-binding domain-containing protein [Parvibaculaceae bacterium]
MKEFRKSLPPLHSLIAFEAAARLSSFSAAAQELNISQAAVSQQIRTLEENLNLTLFDRTHRTVQLTPAGRNYQHTVAMALEHLAMATRDLRVTRGRVRLTVAADQSMAWMWLAPRLAHFQENHPSISVRLVASDLESDCLVNTVDVALIHGDGKWPGRQATLLFAEEVYPVCSETYLKSAPALASPRDLAMHRLLHLEDDHWNWMNWRMWLTENGVDLAAERDGLTVNNYPLLIEAAKKSQGLALGWNGLVDAELAQGALLRPLAQSVSTRFGYYIVWPEQERLPDPVQCFLTWTLAQIPPPAVGSET